jgi:thiol-disulfide isomerase/thioredoxin
VPDAITDAESGLSFLVDRGVLRESDDVVVTASDFEDVRAVYHATYSNVDDDRIYETVADVFDLDVETARARVEEHGLTREELIAFLSLRSFLDADISREETSLLAAIVAEASPPSPVPVELNEITDEDYAGFLDDHPDAVVTVWRRHCDPCDRLRDRFDELRDLAPDRVGFAGIDGESTVEFRREFEVEAAPTTLLFAEGELVERRRGYQPVEAFAEAFEAAYGGS